MLERAHEGDEGGDVCTGEFFAEGGHAAFFAVGDRVGQTSVVDVLVAPPTRVCEIGCIVELAHLCLAAPVCAVTARAVLRVERAPARLRRLGLALLLHRALPVNNAQTRGEEE